MQMLWKGVIEVQCPYSCKQKSIEQRSEDSQFFLKQIEKGDLYLDPYHAYYFQVQAQLTFCSASYADFVVWTEKELSVQRIFPEEPFISIVLQQCETFIKVGILPEMLGKWYSKEPITKNQPSAEDTGNTETGTDQNELWCYCRQPEEGEMIGCDNNACLIQWFHISCLHIKKIPKGKWFCPDCRKLKTKIKKLMFFFFHTYLLRFLH